MSASNDPPASSKLLENLRKFRFDRKELAKIAVHSNGHGSNGSLNDSNTNELQQNGFKHKLNVIPDSSDDDSSKSPVKDVQAGGLKYLQKLFPSLSLTLHNNDFLKKLEQYLITTRGDVKSAEQFILNELNFKIFNNKPNIPPTAENISQMLRDVSSKKESVIMSGQKRKASSTKENKRFKRIKNCAHFSDDDSSDGDDNLRRNRVFDSDEESDVEISNITTEDQKNVLDFLSNARATELLNVAGISRKKADALVELRPFDGWKDLVEKIQNDRLLSTETLNLVQDHLHSRKVIESLLEKCSKLSLELENMDQVTASKIREPPSILSETLKLAGYQMTGLNWLAMLHSRKVNGILADEMGLGKTVQIIAFLAYLKESQSCEGDYHLIVVPASTLENWNNELARWCPSLRVLIYHGSQEDRRAIRWDISENKLSNYDVMLTTYNLLSSRPEEKKMFKVLKFQYVIFDEAHMLKNMKTERYRQLSNLHAKHRILLTGTPLQNNLLELMSLLTFVMPEMFANKKESLKSLFAKNSSVKDSENKDEQVITSKFEQDQILSAKKIMKPFVLRRLKKDVLKDLPKKIDTIEYCPMTDNQRKLYDDAISVYSKKSPDDNESGMAMLMKLRRISNHPLLIRNLYNDDLLSKIAPILAANPNYKENKLEYVLEDLALMSDFDIHCLCKEYSALKKFALSDDVITKSGKLEYLNNKLPQLEQDCHRTLIFSQFVIVLNIISSYLEIRGIPYLRLDGSTPVNERQNLIDEFNSDVAIPVFLLSTRAGGLGINLTSADTVIIHDLDFNPYNDKQAEDRCHRVGQTKPVTVIRLVSKNSVEEDIYLTACQKLHLERELSAQDSKVEASEAKRILKKALNHHSPMKN